MEGSIRGSPPACARRSVSHALCTGTPAFLGRAFSFSDHADRLATAPRIKWSHARYAMGCQTNFKFGAFRYSYCWALSRTVFLSEPSARSRHVLHAMVEGFFAALEAMRSGATCRRCRGSVSAHFRSLACAGILSWLLHPKRLAGGGVSLRDDHETALQPNMTFYKIIGIWETDDGYVSARPLCVADNSTKSSAASRATGSSIAQCAGVQLHRPVHHSKASTVFERR